jgi:hypothetical protein
MHNWVESLVTWLITSLAVLQCIAVAVGLYQENKIAECKAAVAILGTLDLHLIRILWIGHLGLQKEGHEWL